MSIERVRATMKLRQDYEDIRCRYQAARQSGDADELLRIRGEISRIEERLTDIEDGMLSDLFKGDEEHE